MPFSQDAKRSLLQIHSATLLFGFPGLFAKWMTISPPLIVLGRVAFAALTLALIIGGKKMSFKMSSRDFFRLAACGGILAVHWTAFFQSVRVSSVAVGLLSYSSFPLFTAFLEPLFFNEKVDKMNVLFAGLCLSGVFLIIPRFDFANAVFQGVAWGLLSGASFAFLAILNRSLAQSRRRPSFFLAFYQDVFAFFWLLPFIFMDRIRLTSRDIALLALLGVFGTAGAHTLFINGMKRIKAQTASLISSLEPVYGILLAFFFLKETPAMRTLAGGLVILAAVFFATLRTAGGLMKKPLDGFVR